MKIKSEVSWRKINLPQDSFNSRLSFQPTVWPPDFRFASSNNHMRQFLKINPCPSIHPSIPLSIHSPTITPPDIQIMKRNRNSLKMEEEKFGWREHDVICHHAVRDRSKHSSLPPGDRGQAVLTVSVQPALKVGCLLQNADPSTQESL